MANNTIPVCPLMSAGSEYPIMCVQERCAWYIPSLRSCSVFIIGHNAKLEVKDKLEKKEG